MWMNIKILKPKRKLSGDNTKWEEEYSIGEMFVNGSHIIKGDPVELPLDSLPEGLQVEVFTRITLSDGDQVIMIGKPDNEGRVLLKG